MVGENDRETTTQSVIYNRNCPRDVDGEPTGNEKVSSEETKLSRLSVGYIVYRETIRAF